MRTVVAAAILDVAGEIWTLPPPNRHHNVIALMGKKFRQEYTQGFVLSDGTFVDRVQAAQFAYGAGQTATLHHVLFSEDLW